MIKRGQKGFTLIELMIVVAILGILAAVAVPRFASLIDRAREGAAKGSLGALRSAVSVYYAQHEGLFPSTIDSTDFYGTTKFVDAIPTVKLESTESANVVTTYDGNGGWLYTPGTGNVSMNVAGTDLSGDNYSSW